LKAKANVNAVNEGAAHQTPLHVAAENGMQTLYCSWFQCEDKTFSVDNQDSTNLYFIHMQYSHMVCEIILLLLIELMDRR